MAIDIALSQASKERQVDIPKIIVNMRRQRMKMVQNAVRLNPSLVIVSYPVVFYSGRINMHSFMMLYWRHWSVGTHGYQPLTFIKRLKG